MKKSLLSKGYVAQSLNTIQDLKDRVYKVEKKNDKIVILAVLGVAIALICGIAFFVLKDNKYEYDLYDDEYFDEDFDDEFEDDFDEEFAE